MGCWSSSPSLPLIYHLFFKYKILFYDFSFLFLFIANKKIGKKMGFEVTNTVLNLQSYT